VNQSEATLENYSGTVNVHTSAANFDPISIIDLWKENPLGLLRSSFLVSGC